MPTPEPFPDQEAGGLCVGTVRAVMTRTIEQYRDLASQLYDALIEADERAPDEIDGQDFLDQISISDAACIGIVSLLDIRMFELHAVWNWQAAKESRHHIPRDTIHAFKVALDNRTRTAVSDMDLLLDVIDAFSEPDALYEAEDLASEIAAAAFADLTLEERAQLLFALVIEGDTLHRPMRLAGAVIRLFSVEPASAHAQMDRKMVIARAFELAQDLEGL
jgi:hypothetical protein